MAVHLKEVSIVEDFLPLDLGRVEVVLGMQWLKTMGYIGVDWNDLTMTFGTRDTKITIQGDPTLTIAEISLKTMAKSWTEQDQGYVIEFRGLRVEEEEYDYDSEGRPGSEELSPSIKRLLEEFEAVFHLPQRLPPTRKVDHRIVLKDNSLTVNVKQYRYAHIQKNEIERLIGEMLAAWIIHASNSPFSSPVLLVKKN